MSTNDYTTDEFQSTSSARRTTFGSAAQKDQHRFQSTSSARRTTHAERRHNRYCNISIHVLREEDDTPPSGLTALSFYFNPRPPRGGRLRHMCVQTFTAQFQSTSSARRTTQRQLYTRYPGAISIHVLREEDDKNCIIYFTKRRYFNPRPPRGGRQQKYTKNLCIFCAKGTIISPPGSVIRRTAAKRRTQHSTV